MPLAESPYQLSGDPLSRKVGAELEQPRTAVMGRSIGHDATDDSGDYLRAGMAHGEDPLRCTGAPHPILWRHRPLAEETLHLGLRPNAWLVGLPLAESEALLGALRAHASGPKFVHARRSRVGDVLLRVNRTTLQRRERFGAASRRRMYRAQVRGTAAPARAL